MYLWISKRTVIEWSPDHWWVTTKLEVVVVKAELIEWSPDHWWVTTATSSSNGSRNKLNGHQIIGELRQSDLNNQNTELLLNGHQIIGELRLVMVQVWMLL